MRTEVADSSFAVVDRFVAASSLRMIFVGQTGCLRADVSYFLLLHAEKGRQRNAVANRVPASRWVPKILGTCCDRLTHSAHCLT